jgi:hypothetical protein
VKIANVFLTHTGNRLSIDQQCQMVSPIPN